jgi:hypothetical protein
MKVPKGCGGNEGSLGCLGQFWSRDMYHENLFMIVKGYVFPNSRNHCMA